VGSSSGFCSFASDHINARLVKSDIGWSYVPFGHATKTPNIERILRYKIDNLMSKPTSQQRPETT
jgi:hypothetical protein